jgi:hypothetical protein
MSLAGRETWQCFQSLEDFPNHADSWDALNHSLLQDHPMGDSCFVGPLIKHFANSGDVLAVRSVGTKNQSMLLLRPGRFGVVTSFRPAQTEICPVLTRSIEDLQSLFEVLPLSTLALQFHCQDPDYCVFPDKSSSLFFEVDEHATTVCIDIEGKFEEYWCERPAKLRKNIDRYQRKLSRKGIDWEFSTVDSPQEILCAVDRYGELETRGWKHQVGTAVHSTNTQGQFYREVLGGFAERGKGIVYELYFDGRLVSSQLAIANDSMVITLKTTYDEAYGKYSPGKLLDYLTVRHEFELGRFSKVEFCTNAGPELIRWGTRSRPISHITVFRNKSSWRLARAYRRVKSIKTLRHPLLGGRAQSQIHTRDKRE